MKCESVLKVFFKLETRNNKKSTEKQFVKSSPDGADILVKSRRASKIKARAGQDVFWNPVELLQKKNPDCSRFFDLFETIILVFSLP